MTGKRVQFDEETWQALDLLARDSMKTFQELADEAFTDLLNKHGRPTDLTMALKQTARAPAPLDRSRQPQETPPRKKRGRVRTKVRKRTSRR